MTEQIPKIPTNANRKQVYVWYHKLAHEVVKKVIVHAIEKVNKESAVQISIYSRTLNGRHLAIIFEELDLPPKFKQNENN